MPKYAQIDVTTGKCIGVSFLSGEVEADNMKLLSDEDNVNPNDTYDNGVWIPAPPPEPVSPLELKLAELNAACNAAILAGFTSDALGTPHTYSFDQEAQTNLGGIYSAILGGLITTPRNWRASGIPVSHTVDQLKMLFAHGLNHKNTNIGRYQILEAQAKTASPEGLAAIVW